MPGNIRITNQISGTSKTVSGTQNLERNVPNTAHKNDPDNSLLLGTLFLLALKNALELRRLITARAN